MNRLLKIAVLPLLISTAYAQGDLNVNGDQGKYTNITNTTSEKHSPDLVALNLPGINSPNINDLATSGASSASELSVDQNHIDGDELATISDPWEGYNRKMHSFNNQLDKYVTRPLAIAYEKVTPIPVQNCVSRFFSNLREPGTAVNQALQGNTFDGMKTLGRFAVNTTIGIAGLYDPATTFGMKKDYEDFGQTLAVWGWEDSRYFVAPIFGPRTVRDMVGVVGDQPLSPINSISDSNVMLGLNVLQLTDARTRLLVLDDMREQSVDEYVMIRDAWATKRVKQIQEE